MSIRRHLGRSQGASATSCLVPDISITPQGTPSPSGSPPTLSSPPSSRTHQWVVTFTTTFSGWCSTLTFSCQGCLRIKMSWLCLLDSTAKNGGGGDSIEMGRLQFPGPSRSRRHRDSHTNTLGFCWMARRPVHRHVRWLRVETSALKQKSEPPATHGRDQPFLFLTRVSGVWGQKRWWACWARGWSSDRRGPRGPGPSALSGTSPVPRWRPRTPRPASPGHSGSLLEHAVTLPSSVKINLATV